MSDMEDMLVDPFRRMLADVADAQAVRAAERTGDIGPIWAAINASGYLDALLPEEQGGAGLRLEDIYPLVTETGAASLPVPFAETVVARALLAARGATAPADAIIVLAAPSPVVPLARAATHALVSNGDRIDLVRLDEAGDDAFGTLGGPVIAASEPVLSIEADGVDLTVFAAGLLAAKMAGAMRRLLDMSLRFAEERQQFGRPLGKFQAIQHQLAVMAEQVITVQVAANIGMSGDHFDPLKVALAKCRASEASHEVCAIAHAVHGAIGVTAEYDLQLLTRRLKEWQLAFGSESYWAARIGSARIRQTRGTSADFVREHLQAGVMI